jgi:hypothetical protein
MSSADYGFTYYSTYAVNTPCYATLMWLFDNRHSYSHPSEVSSGSGPLRYATYLSSTGRTTGGNAAIDIVLKDHLQVHFL